MWSLWEGTILEYLSNTQNYSVWLDISSRVTYFVVYRESALIEAHEHYILYERTFWNDWSALFPIPVITRLFILLFSLDSLEIFRYTF